MKRALFFTGLVILAVCPGRGTLAQDLFLKKGGSTPSSANSAQNTEDKKAPAPLFLDGGSSAGADVSPSAARPLFLENPAKSSSSVSSRAAARKGAVFDLQKRKSANVKGASEPTTAALDKTRLANMAAIQKETARLQAETDQALARSQAEWETRQALILQAEQQKAGTGQQDISAPGGNTSFSSGTENNGAAVKPAGRKQTSPAPSADDTAGSLPRPVFNTRH